MPGATRWRSPGGDQVHPDGALQDDIDEILDSALVRLFALNSPAKDWARYGAEHPMGPDFKGVQDLIPQLIDEETALSYVSKAPRELIKDLFAVGMPDEIVDQLAEFRDQGLRCLVVGNMGALHPKLSKSAAATARRLIECRRPRRRPTLELEIRLDVPSIQPPLSLASAIHLRLSVLARQRLDVVHERLQRRGGIQLERLGLLLVDQHVTRTEEIRLAGAGDLVGPVGAGIPAADAALEDVPVVGARAHTAGQPLIERRVVAGPGDGVADLHVAPLRGSKSRAAQRPSTIAADRKIVGSAHRHGSPPLLERQLAQLLQPERQVDLELLVEAATTALPRRLVESGEDLRLPGCRNPASSTGKKR